MRHLLSTTASWVLVLAASLSAAPAAAQERTVRISVGMNGQEANGRSISPDLSADGRFVVFQSEASNLVPGDTNGVPDIFVVDRVLHTTERVSVGSSGAEANGQCILPINYDDGSVLSSDGRFVVFVSLASNLVAQDTNGVSDVFVRDRQNGSTRRVSRSSGGLEGNGPSFAATISDDGSTVAFSSSASNLVPGDSNAHVDVFVHALASGSTERVSVSTGGVQGDLNSFSPSVNGDGSIIAFMSSASNLTPHYTWFWNVYVRDRVLGTTQLASISSTGVPAARISEGPSVSSSGRYIAFFSYASNLAPDVNNAQDMFVHDRLTGSTTLESLRSNGAQGNGTSGGGQLSASARHLVFASSSTNLGQGPVTPGFNTYLRDRVTGRLDLVNVDLVGQNSGVAVDGTALSESGEVAFSSASAGLVVGDTNGVSDIFIREFFPPSARAYCDSRPDSQGCLPEVASSGRPSAYVATPFMLAAGQVLNGKLGLLVYGTAPDSRPWGSGTRCVRIPFHRTAVQTTGGNVGPPDCSGSLSLDFNARIRSGVDPALVPGAEVYAQFLYRDPGALPALGTTRGLHFTVLP